MSTEDDFRGAKWTPSNGMEGADFMERWRRICSRDKAMREGADFDECDDNEMCEFVQQHGGL